MTKMETRGEIVIGERKKNSFVCYLKNHIYGNK